MAIIGIAEASFQNSSFHSIASIPPVRKSLAVAPFTTYEYLSRTLRALERFPTTTVVNLILDGTDLLSESDGDEVSLERARAYLVSAFMREGAVTELMLAYRDGHQEFTISIEGRVVHEAASPAIVLLVAAGLPVTDDEVVKSPESMSSSDRV